MASSVFIFPGSYTIGDITVTGVVLASDGTAAAPSYSFASRPTTGIFHDDTYITSTVISAGGSSAVQVDTNGLLLFNGKSLNFTATNASNFDVSIFRDAANTLGLRNGTNPQIFTFYNTYTDASNYERVFAGFVSNTAFFTTEHLGTGTARAMAIGTGGSAALNFRTAATTRWSVGASTGHLLAASGVGYGPSVPAVINTAPTISSGFGTSPSIVASNGTAAFTINVGTGGTANSGVITMPAATTGWIAHVENLTGTLGNYANQRTVQIASTATSITLENQTISTGAALAWTASDVLVVTATGY